MLNRASLHVDVVVRYNVPVCAVIEIALHALRLFALVMVVASAACDTTTPTMTLEPTTTPRPTRSQSAVSSAKPVPTTTPSVSPDRYPAELVGRAFILQADEESEEFTVGRLGMRERLKLPAGERVLGVAGDRVVSVAVAGSGSLVTVWSIHSGEPVFDSAALPDVGEPFGLTAGEFVILSPTRLPDGVAGAVFAMSTVDGSLRTLVASGRPAGIPNPFREVVVSAEGDRVLAAVCSAAIDAVFGCRTAKVFKPATGDIVATIDTDGDPVQAIWGKWSFVGGPLRAAIVDAKNHEAWSTRALDAHVFVVGVEARTDGTVLARLQRFVSGADEGLIRIDPSTGQHTFLLRPGEQETWGYWPQLSTDRLLALGPGGASCMAPYPCGPHSSRELDDAVYDVETGTIMDHAIHITFSE